ncbi:MAG: hypothetical protein SF053_01015 [Bacteroidia bacterium]|nr:hypothetical protein [Bacteroidia bacterium]
MNPSEQLAKRILERLQKESLLSPSQAQRIEKPISEGKIKASDWKLPIELSIKELQNPS